MDSIRVSEAPDPGSIPGEATLHIPAHWQIKGRFFIFLIGLFFCIEFDKIGVY